MINTDLLSTGSTFAVGMANHLWQSSLFSAAAWLITIFLKKIMPVFVTGSGFILLCGGQVHDLFLNVNWRAMNPYCSPERIRGYMPKGFLKYVSIILSLRWCVSQELSGLI